jgi:hypothetical protein
LLRHLVRQSVAASHAANALPMDGVLCLRLFQLVFLRSKRKR